MFDFFNIIKSSHGVFLGKKTDIKFNDFVIDTRKIKNGDIFVGIKGESLNGNNFYKEAFKNGASACILDNDTDIDDNDKNKNIILVDNTVKALQDIAKYKRSLYDIPVVGVTGSVGKTSVKDMIYKVLSSQYNVLSTEGNFNNEIGLPLTILKLRDHDMMVVEMGMNHAGEMHNLTSIAKPTIAVITNIGTAHIGNLGSRENILKAKLEILDGMINGTLIINNDNDLLSTIKYDNLITIGIDNDSDYMAKDINDMVFSSNFYIEDNYIELPLGSNAFVYNALFAYAVGMKLGISKENIIKSLKDFKLTSHRLELIKLSNMNVIDDTYNASYDSVKNSLEMLSKVNTRKVFIFGDILELNEYGKDIHRDIGKLVIDNNIDVLISVGNLTKYTYDIVYDKGIEAYHFDTNKELLEEIDEITDHDDTVLIKGSHGMNLIEIVEYLKKAYPVG